VQPYDGGFDFWVGNSGYNTHLVCWAIFLATLVCGVLSLYFGLQQRKVVTNSKDDVLDEMKRLERKYEQ
jgi:uncharacterized protein HemX